MTLALLTNSVYKNLRVSIQGIGQASIRTRFANAVKEDLPKAQRGEGKRTPSENKNKEGGRESELLRLE